MLKPKCLAFGTKTYYRPIEAAIRWSGLLRFERRILTILKHRPMPEPSEFPRWPMLRLNAERIFDAIAHEELPYGKESLALEIQSVPLSDPALTIRHVDLKAWMSRYYPGEKPAFLFDDFERVLHPTISLDTVSALLADREAARSRLAEHQKALEALRTEHEALLKAHSDCTSTAQRTNVPGPRSESTYLNIIGGLLTLLLGTSPSGVAYSSFRNLEAVISALLVHHDGRPGISERTLWSKLAEARRHIERSG